MGYSTQSFLEALSGYSKRMTRLVVAFLFLSVQFSVLGISRVSANNDNYDNDQEDKVWICHRNNAVSNRYSAIHVSKEAINGGDKSDHEHHDGPFAHSEEHAQELKDNKIEWGDVIPQYDDFSGVNWDSEVAQEYYYANCYNGGEVLGDCDENHEFYQYEEDEEDEDCQDVEPCVAGPGFASFVDSYTQGMVKGGGAVAPERSDPDHVLGAPDATTAPVDGFFSIGMEGEMVVGFGGYVINEDGNDLSFHEITNGRSTYPEELLEVEVSQDGETWYPVGVVSSKDASDGVSYLDFNDTGLGWIKWVKMIDATNYVIHSNGADGYDIDAVDATYIACEQPEEPIEPCVVNVYSDTTNTVNEYEDANAMALSWVHPAWSASIDGATWIWGDDPVADPGAETIQTFRKQFYWNGPVTSAVLDIAADNDFVVYVNGVEVAFDYSGTSFQNQKQFDLSGDVLSDSWNTIEIVVTNWEWPTSNPQSNPAGLLYRLQVTGPEEDCGQEPEQEIEPCEVGSEIFMIGDDEVDQANDNPADEFSFNGFGDFSLPVDDPFVVGTSTTDHFPWNSNFNKEFATDFEVEFYYGGAETLPEATLTVAWSPGKSAKETKKIYLDGSMVGMTTHTGANSPGWFSNMQVYDDAFVIIDLTPGWHTLRFEHTVGDGTLWDFVRLEETTCPENEEQEDEGIIRGLIYNDLDNSGSRDDGEPALENWNAMLFTHNSPYTLVAVTQTDENGQFVFEHLGFGPKYVVCQELQLGWEQTQIAAGTDTIGGLTIGYVVSDDSDLHNLIRNNCYGAGEEGDENAPIVLSSVSPESDITVFGNYQPDEEEEEDPEETYTPNVLGTSTTRLDDPGFDKNLDQGGQVLAATDTLAATGKVPLVNIFVGIAVVSVALLLVIILDNKSTIN